MPPRPYRRVGRAVRSTAAAGPIVMTAAATVVVAGSFRQWVVTGHRGRTSYELLGLIHRLGFAPDGAAELMVRGWPLMPLLVTAGVVAVWWGRRTIGAVLAAAGGAYAAAVGGLVESSASHARGVDVSGAPTITAAGAVALVLGSLLVLVVGAPSAGVRSR